MSEPTGAGWVHGCFFCKRRWASLMTCHCLDCNSDYILCSECLDAMADLGMADERIEEYIQESGNNFTPRHVTRVHHHDLTQCPKDDGVRVAVVLGRGK